MELNSRHYALLIGAIMIGSLTQIVCSDLLGMPELVSIAAIAVAWAGLYWMIVQRHKPKTERRASSLQRDGNGKRVWRYCWVFFLIAPQIMNAFQATEDIVHDALRGYHGHDSMIEIGNVVWMIPASMLICYVAFGVQSAVGGVLIGILSRRASLTTEIIVAAALLGIVDLTTVYYFPPGVRSIPDILRLVHSWWGLFFACGGITAGVICVLIARRKVTVSVVSLADRFT